MDKPKSKDFVSVLKNLNLTDKKTLVLVPERNDNAFLSARNVERSQVQIASLVNTYDIMNSSNIVFVGNAHEVITELLKK
jgi:large subunit ribosomal protein L4